MPIRRQQLYETYVETGPIPLIPGTGATAAGKWRSGCWQPSLVQWIARPAILIIACPCLAASHALKHTYPPACPLLQTRSPAASHSRWAAWSRGPPDMCKF